MTTERSTFRAKVGETDLPNVVGWRWVGEPWVDGEGLERITEHELCWTRPGAGPMLYSVRTTPETKWTHIVSKHPRMVGIETLAEARKVAHWFIHGEEGDRP